MKYLFAAVFLLFAACAGNQLNQAQVPPPALPVIQLSTGSATTWQEYPASVEGTVNIEIRPQVSGYLEKIFVEEGAYVNQGQPLFRINSNEFNELANNASASIQVARQYRKGAGGSGSYPPAGGEQSGG